MTDEHPPDTVRPGDSSGDVLPERDRSDAVIVTWQPAGRAARRLVFLPRASAGPDWERVEQARGDDGEWHKVGSEAVERVGVED